MLYVQLDVNWVDNPAVMEVGLDGAGLHAKCAVLATDLGQRRLSTSQVAELGGTDDLVATLVAAGLLCPAADGTFAVDTAGFVPLPDAQWKAAERARVTRAVRQIVFERDEYACRTCGATEPLQVDHVYPLARGGTSALDNLQTLCGPCNRRKWAHVPAEWA